MILSDKQILEEITKGTIKVEPFRRECLGTNSYDVHLGKYLATYRNRVLDAKKHNEIDHFEIPERREFLSLARLDYDAFEHNIEVNETFGLFLLIGLIAMIIVLIVSHFMNNYSNYHKIISGILLFLFSLYLIYDTTNILIRDFYKGDFISASLDEYLDIINIFVNLLNFSN